MKNVFKFIALSALLMSSRYLLVARLRRLRRQGQLKER